MRPKKIEPGSASSAWKCLIESMIRSARSSMLLTPEAAAVQRVAVDGDGDDPILRQALLEVVVAQIAGIGRDVVAVGHDHDRDAADAWPAAC